MKWKRASGDLSYICKTSGVINMTQCWAVKCQHESKTQCNRYENAIMDV